MNAHIYIYIYALYMYKIEGNKNIQYNQCPLVVKHSNGNYELNSRFIMVYRFIAWRKKTDM